MKLKSAIVEARITFHSIQPGDYEDLCCLVCDAPLKIHQPEEEIPSRMLGSCTCEGCGLWYLLALSPYNRTDMYMIRLPEIAELWEALFRQDRLERGASEA